MDQRLTCLNCGALDPVWQVEGNPADDWEVWWCAACSLPVDGGERGRLGRAWLRWRYRVRMGLWAVFCWL